MRQSGVRGREARGGALAARDGGGRHEDHEGGAASDEDISGGGPPAPPRGGRRVLRWFSTALSVLILGSAGAGYLYYEHLNGNLDKDLLNLGDSRLDRSKPNAAGQTPLNILLLGSDSRNSKENVRLGGARDDVGRKPLADVQMLLHVAADRSSMSVLSVPRDTRVTIPRCTDPKDDKVYPQTTDTINHSLQNGGPGCTVATWERLTGVPVDHFMMIDFAGVVDMADAVGGVPVCVKDDIHDRKSGLRLRGGETVIKGEQALQWLRTRHGFADGSDIGRAKAQHMYLNSMVRQLKSGTKLTDPGKLQDLAEAATKALTVDEALGTVKSLYDLGNDLKRVPTDRVTMATMPWVPDAQNPAHVVPKPGDAEKVFSLLRGDVALDGKDRGKDREDDGKGGGKGGKAEDGPAAGEIAVAVRNGTGTVTQAPVAGRATVLADRLRQLGFDRAVADSAVAPQVETTVAYPEQEPESTARAVAEALGLPDGAVRRSADVQQVTLTVGSDWREGTAYPASAEPGGTGGEDGGSGSGGEDGDGGKAPESADALGGGDKKACMAVNPASTW